MGKYEVGMQVTIKRYTGKRPELYPKEMDKFVGVTTFIACRAAQDGYWRLQATPEYPDLDGYFFEVDWLRLHGEAISEELPSVGTCTPIKKHNHYFKNVAHLEELDVYRLIDLYAITDPCIQHMLKKCLVVGGRGSKDALRDVQDIIDTAERWKQMQQENALLVK